MTNLPDGLTQAELDQYAKLSDAKKRIEDALKPLNEKIKESVGLGSHVFGRVVVERTEANSVDAKAAAAELTIDKNPELWEPTFNAKALTPEQKAKFSTKTQRLSVKVLANADEQ